MTGETDEKKYWLQVTIELDPILEEAVIDYLVGVLGAGVEQAAEHEGDTLLLNGFLDECNPDEGRRQELCTGVEARCRELADLLGFPVRVSPGSGSWIRTGRVTGRSISSPLPLFPIW